MRTRLRLYRGSYRLQLSSLGVVTALERGEHGVTSWRLGCRCGRCRAGLHRRSKIWWATAQLRRGRDVASYVPAARARARIEELRAAGWTSHAIARAAGISDAAVCKIRKPGTRVCSRIVARAVLAIDS